jgi:hypothetical protein
MELTFYTTKLCQVIHHRFAGDNVVVDKRQAFLVTIFTTSDTEPGQRECTRSNQRFGTVASDFCFFLSQGHEFRINGDQRARGGHFVFGQDVVAGLFRRVPLKTSQSCTHTHTHTHTHDKHIDHLLGNRHLFKEERVIHFAGQRIKIEQAVDIHSGILDYCRCLKRERERAIQVPVHPFGS